MQAAKINPDDGEAYINLGHVLYEEGQYSPPAVDQLIHSGRSRWTQAAPLAEANRHRHVGPCRPRLAARSRRVVVRQLPDQSDPDGQSERPGEGKARAAAQHLARRIRHASFCTTASCQSHLGNQGNSGGQRSDVIIILRLVPADRGLEMLSIPRNTWVSIADSGGQTNRINAAFNTGPSQLVKTIEQDFRIPINYYAYANFLGFTNVVQALGGIWMDFPDPVRDAETGLNIKKTGCQFLNGVEALQLVRSRDLYYYANGQWNVDGLGDLSRIRRQESFFHAIIDKADSDRNPIQINDFIQNAVRNIEIDPGLKSNLLNLALTFRGVASANLHTEVMPTSGAVYNGADILLPVWKLDNAMVAELPQDRNDQGEVDDRIHVADDLDVDDDDDVAGGDRNDNGPDRRQREELPGAVEPGSL